jgi:hypothetical protein
MIVAVGIIVAVGLIALAVRYRTEERRALDYMAAATEIAQSQAESADSLTQMLIDLGALERQDIISRIEALGAQASSDAQLLAAQVVPASVAEANGYLTVALGAWHESLTSLDAAILLILDTEEDESEGNGALTAAFDLLRVGDRAFVLFLDARARVEGDVTAGTVADVAYVAQGRKNLFDGTRIAGRLRATLKFGERHDISVTARTIPDALGTRNDRPVVPTSETFAVVAVVTNQGNLTEEGIEVTMVLGAGSSDETRITREQLILSLDPGEATTVEFSDIVLIPGALYDLRITASIAEDADPLNNVFELAFYRNQDE